MSLGLGLAGLLALPVLSEVRIRRAERAPSERWRAMPIEPCGATLLGMSYRPLQATALGLDARQSLRDLLALPFHVIRLGAYWNQLEPAPDTFRFEALDAQLDLAERAGKHIIVNVGAVKTFGYPEYFVPDHQLAHPLPEGTLVTPNTHPALLAAAQAHVTRLVARYRDRSAILAWQVEHEPVDPLGVEHSWRLSAGFVEDEVRAVRAADPSRPILLNGFLPTSSPVAAQQWWRTRDQGDSLAVARRLADIVGVDYYARHALARVGPLTAYLDGSHALWPHQRSRHLLTWASALGRPLMVTEGQAEPWEAVTTPPNPARRQLYSCPPEQLIANYNRCMRWAHQSNLAPHAYLFWGAEYWLARERAGDSSYLLAARRILDQG